MGGVLCTPDEVGLPPRGGEPSAPHAPLPAEIHGVCSPPAPSVDCSRQLSSPLRNPLSVPGAVIDALSSNFPQLLTSVLIVGLSFVWLTLALPDCNFVFVPSIQEGNCLCHSLKKKKNYCIVDLHCCVNFCCKAKLLSYTCIFFFIFFSFMIFHGIE